MPWRYTPVPADLLREICGNLGVSPVLGELLLKGGFSDPIAASPFLAPRLADLSDPFLLPQVGEAVERLRLAIARKEKVVVLGDYDVDGVSSTALLVGILRRFGISPRFIVPRRMQEGYGLSRTAVDRALEAERPDLFVALDCGTNSGEVIAYLRSCGVDVIVVDHHRPLAAPALDCIFINPHVASGAAGEQAKNFCTVGLVFKLVHALLKRLRAEGLAAAHEVVLRDYLDLVALGTVADIVPLLGENRIFARHGLRALETTARPGLRALMEVSGIRPLSRLSPMDISFRLGPRINASGRLADAALSVELLLSSDPVFCRNAARQLDGFNSERQDIEREITEMAERLVMERFLQARGIVLYDEAWHPGVVGIVASRVTRKYHRPCIVLGNEGEFAKGSGRSIRGLNLVEIMPDCEHALLHWGGHPMAVGVAMHKGELERFRTLFDAAVFQRSGGAGAEASLDIACWLELEGLSEELMLELDSMHPYGEGNPEPVFGLRSVLLRKNPEVFKQRHFRFQVEFRGRRFFGVAWKQAERIPPAGVPIDLAVQLDWNHFNGRKYLQMELRDWRFAG